MSAVVIGSGRVGTSLIKTLPKRGIAVRALVSREPDKISSRFDIPVVSRLEEVDGTFNLLILAVPDSDLQDYASRLAVSERDLTSICAIHTSGSISSTVLAPLRPRGAMLLSFHPITAFPATESDVDPFEGIVVSLEGDPEALKVGRRLAECLRSIPIEVTTEQKEKIHVAASIAANFTTTLASVADSILSAAGIEPSTSSVILTTLIQSVVDNLRHGEPSGALTGPIVRGDANVVEGHLTTLSQMSSPSEYTDLYRLLAIRTLELARQSGRLSSEEARRIRSALGVN